MIKFAANLSTMFGEVPFLERFAAARKAGFKAVEFQFPYAFGANDVAARSRDSGLEVVLFNLPPGDFDKGERGIACHPDRIAEFQEGVDRALEYAAALSCRTINCLAGIKPAELDRSEAFDTLCENLSYAAKRLQEKGVALVIEPINGIDIPGFFLNRSSEAMAAIDQVASPNLKLQYDLYHMQRTEGELSATLTRLMPRIGHIQIADPPARHEPGTGEINFPNMLKHIDALGYAGWIGCEYKPRGGTEDGLSWLTDMGFKL